MMPGCKHIHASAAEYQSNFDNIQPSIVIKANTVKYSQEQAAMNTHVQICYHTCMKVCCTQTDTVHITQSNLHSFSHIHTHVHVIIVHL